MINRVSEFSDAAVRMNNITFDELCRRYGETGFLYKAKRERLSPAWGNLSRTWESLLKSDSNVFACLHTDESESDSKGWSSITGWRAASGSWFWQHMVSVGDPRLVWRVLMAAQRWQESLPVEAMSTGQYWFQPNDGLASRIYSEAATYLGPRTASLVQRILLEYPTNMNVTLPRIQRCEIAKVERNSIPEIARFVANLLGVVYARAEELQTDPFLDDVNQIYFDSGLTRRREIFSCRGLNEHDLRGIALVHRGPTGVNFSLLESRIDILLRDDLAHDERAYVTHELVNAARHAADEVSVCRIVTDKITADALAVRGATIVREYMRFTWLRAGLERFGYLLESNCE